MENRGTIVGMKFSLEPLSAGQVIRQAGDRVEDLNDVVREARRVDAGDAGSLLVGGAVSVFFDDRSEAVADLQATARDVLRGASEVVEIYDSGDGEMARQTRSLERDGHTFGNFLR